MLLRSRIRLMVTSSLDVTQPALSAKPVPHWQEVKQNNAEKFIGWR